MANLRMLLAFGIGLLVFAEAVQAAPKRSRSRQPNITVIQLPAAAAPCCCNTGGSAGNVPAAAPMVITVNGANSANTVSVEQAGSAGDASVAAPVITANAVSGATVESVKETSDEQTGLVLNSTVAAPATTADEISGGGGVLVSVEEISDEMIGRGMKSTLYERLRKAVLAWQAVPEHFQVCRTQDPGNTISQFELDLVADKVNSDKVRISMAGWNVAVLTAVGESCTGVLVSNRHVMFAASCMQDISHAANLTVLFNILSISDKFSNYVKSDAWNVFGVNAAAQHPLYKPNGLPDNVALLELKRNAPLGLQVGVAKIRPACIPRTSVSLIGNDETPAEACVMMSYEKSQGPPLLSVRTVRKFKPLDYCQRIFPAYQRERQTCAEGYEGYAGKTIRCGNVGAGLLYKLQTDEGSKTAEEKKWYLVGIASYSKYNCDGLSVYQNTWTGFAADNSTAL